MKITNENEYIQSLERYKAIAEKVWNLRIELRSIYDNIAEYQGTETYRKDRGGNASCEMRSREFEELKSKKE